MPNHVSHRVIVTGPLRQLSWLLNHFREDGTIDFQSILPMPGVLLGTVSPDNFDHPSLRNKMALIETGYSSWYTWKRDHWNTKWGGYNGTIARKPPNVSPFFDVTQDAIGEMEFTFDTAWSIPTPILNKLAELHPDCEFHLMAFDEGWGFGVDQTFKGSFVLNPEPRGGNGATKELYEKVHGHPYENEDEEE